MFADDSDSGFSISNTPRGSCIATNGDPFYEHQADDNTKSHIETETATNTMHSEQKQMSRIPVKKCNTNPWSFKVPKPVTGACNCAASSADAVTPADTLASDLMKEEQRDCFVNIDTIRETRSDLIAAVQSRSSRVRPKIKQNNCVTEIKNKQNSRYQNCNVSANVADCSARTLPKSHYTRDRSNSTGINTRQSQVKVGQGHSFSVDDLSRRLLNHRPSASFEEAIERGYISDTAYKGGDSISEEEIPIFVNECSKSRNEPNKPHKNLLRRHHSEVADTCVSTSVDEVFVDDGCLDCVLNGYHGDMTSQISPKHMTRQIKPVSTSYSNGHVPYPHKLRDNHKLLAVSFESQPRRASIELTKDNLILHRADDSFLNAGDKVHATDDSSDTDTEPLPGELFTEINEHTLAALKRHGSSLNVAPSSENSPRTAPLHCACKYSLCSHSSV